MVLWQESKRVFRAHFRIEIEAFYTITAQSLTFKAETLEEQRPSKL